MSANADTKGSVIMREKLRFHMHGERTGVLGQMKSGVGRAGSIAFVTGFGLLLAFSCFTPAMALTPLDTKIEAVQSATDKLKADVPGLIARASLLEQQLDHGTLLAGDYVAGHPGETVTLPFLFVPSFFNATGIEADIVVPSKLTISSTTVGAAALAAQKIVSTNTVNGVERFLIFGLNQNVIPWGEVILLSINIPSNTPPGQYPIVIDNPIASDADGDPVLMSVMSGIVEVL